MDITHEDDGSKGVFYVKQENRRLAELTYVWAGTEKIIIDHTEVNPALKGQGVGRQLVAAAAAFARERGIKIIPLCPFAKRVMQKSEEFNDIL